jgi:hypothetical protein
VLGNLGGAFGFTSSLGGWWDRQFANVVIVVFSIVRDHCCVVCLVEDLHDCDRVSRKFCREVLYIVL